ncbi:MAG: hypothetical protein ACTSRK_13325 [Promethearchaeota archaeon]
MLRKYFACRGKKYSLDDVLIQIFEGLQSERVYKSFVAITNRQKFPVEPSHRSIIDYGEWLLTEHKRKTSEIKRDIIRKLLSREFYRVICDGYPGYVTFLPEKLFEITMDHLLQFLDLILTDSEYSNIGIGSESEVESEIESRSEVEHEIASGKEDFIGKIEKENFETITKMITWESLK